MTVANFASADPVDGGAGGGNALCGQDQLQMLGNILQTSYCKTREVLDPSGLPTCYGNKTTTQNYICLRSNGTFYPPLPGGVATIINYGVEVPCGSRRCN